MAFIKMHQEEVRMAVSNIESDISDYQQLGSEIREIMSSLSCWEGSDKDTYCKSVDAALNKFKILTQAIKEYNKTIEICISKYEDCFDVTTQKAKTI